MIELNRWTEIVVIEISKLSYTGAEVAERVDSDRVKMPWSAVVVSVVDCDLESLNACDELFWPTRSVVLA